MQESILSAMRPGTARSARAAHRRARSEREVAEEARQRVRELEALNAHLFKRNQTLQEENEDGGGLITALQDQVSGLDNELRRLAEGLGSKYNSLLAFAYFQMPEVTLNVMHEEQLASIPPETYRVVDSNITHVQLPEGIIAYAMTGDTKSRPLAVACKFFLRRLRVRFVNNLTDKLQTYWSDESAFYVVARGQGTPRGRFAVLGDKRLVAELDEERSRNDALGYSGSDDEDWRMCAEHIAEHVLEAAARIDEEELPHWGEAESNRFPSATGGPSKDFFDAARGVLLSRRGAWRMKLGPNDGPMQCVPYRVDLKPDAVMPKVPATRRYSIAAMEELRKRTKQFVDAGIWIPDDEAKAKVLSPVHMVDRSNIGKPHRLTIDKVAFNKCLEPINASTMTLEELVAVFRGVLFATVIDDTDGYTQCPVEDPTYNGVATPIGNFLMTRVSQGERNSVGYYEGVKNTVHSKQVTEGRAVIKISSLASSLIS